MTDQPGPPDAQNAPSVWRFARASRAHVVVDAADYFALMQTAMLRARQRIEIPPPSTTQAKVSPNLPATVTTRFSTYRLRVNEIKNAYNYLCE